MSKWFPIVLLLVSFSVSAQTRFDVGVSAGTQGYSSTSDDPRVLTGLDFLLRGNRIGAHLAGEYADLTDEGALVAVHANAVYHADLGRNFSFLAGAGPSLISIGSTSWTWNAEIELARKFGRMSVIGRVRHDDFELNREHRDFVEDAGPDGPAMYLGARFNIR